MEHQKGTANTHDLPLDFAKISLTILPNKQLAHLRIVLYVVVFVKWVGEPLASLWMLQW